MQITFVKIGEDVFQEDKSRQCWKPLGQGGRLCSVVGSSAIRLTHRGDFWTVKMTDRAIPEIHGITEGLMFSLGWPSTIFFTLESHPEKPGEVLLVGWKQEE